MTRITAELSGLGEALKSAEIIARMGAMKAMSRAGDDLKEELRDQVRGAGLSERLAKTWQGKVYPEHGQSLSPAAYVWSKAPGIIDAYARGATIVATGGRRLLALPTPDVPRKRAGNALTPREVESRYNRRLRFVPAKSAHGSLLGGRAVAYLLLDGLVAKKESGRLRNASARELAGTSRNKGRTVRSVVMFTLVASAKVPKKLDLQGALNRVAAELPQLLAEEWSGS